jgi:putative Mg2+ transporter-C (MgtC) family protein
MTPWPALDLLLRDTGLLVLAWVLGGLIGWQREAQGRAAGLRTHVLVCVGSCLITLVSFGGLGDPGRIAAQVVSGIGFLGAGVILRRGVSVRGLTTAASVWVVAGIGIAAGAGDEFAVLASVATILVLLTLTQAKRLEQAIQKDKRFAAVTITLPRYQGAVGRAIEALTETGADVVGYEADEEDSDGMRTVRVALRLRQDVTRAALTQALSDKLPKATVEWEEAG